MFLNHRKKQTDGKEIIHMWFYVLLDLTFGAFIHFAVGLSTSAEASAPPLNLLQYRCAIFLDTRQPAGIGVFI